MDEVRGGLDALRNGGGGESAAEIRTESQALMMEKCSVFRNEAALTELGQGLEALRQRAQNISIMDKSEGFNT